MAQINKFIASENIYLRAYEETSDLDLLHFGKNSSEVRDTLFLFSPVTKKQVAEEMEKLVAAKENELFTICESSTNIPIGVTGLFRIDFISRAAIFFIAIYNPEFWSKGYGKEATKLILKYSFDILNLNRIQLHVAKSNVKGVKAYEKAGFKIEGTLREAMYHNNEYIDFYVMGILRKEYYKEPEM
ncbi:MAG: GNAT family N-acetyltransferase [Bacteroidetes bacterium]|nr:GNAT family N-acetyltransferase [Bacteroidota bacterium]MBU1114811.1 GNAT family N-acetyltransferase [Bacteroidota bacterium]MBU1797281.1 GNAT family N-acetyltransferase [Bacteroidota bacterium]